MALAAPFELEDLVARDKEVRQEADSKEDDENRRLYLEFITLHRDVQLRYIENGEIEKYKATCTGFTRPTERDMNTKGAKINEHEIKCIQNADWDGFFEWYRLTTVPLASDVALSAKERIEDKLIEFKTKNMWTWFKMLRDASGGINIDSYNVRVKQCSYMTGPEKSPELYWQSVEATGYALDTGFIESIERSVGGDFTDFKTRPADQTPETPLPVGTSDGVGNGYGEPVPPPAEAPGAVPAPAAPAALNPTPIATLDPVPVVGEDKPDQE